MDRKVFLTLTVRNVPMSLSARRAWIENLLLAAGVILAASLSARRAWIEKTVRTTIITICMSLSARRAWIEKYVI